MSPLWASILENCSVGASILENCSVGASNR